MSSTEAFRHTFTLLPGLRSTRGNRVERAREAAVGILTILRVRCTITCREASTKGTLSPVCATVVPLERNPLYSGM
ncbi:hypothetical protein RSOLAG1IB_05090 [Rhizoctonia solani AG-1 IB]|uniref:Uncharacterized protein n=1 Tax=Thanatephorus cucumeris (strain AG1-IB / isolate 7/3/14) TaxID=1108050 RepID=A0A0B7G2M0_THACB|nr:hypothetical protein RSOLAG1IB_05090 [Rhizoctonia solani AG-1 IB]